MQDVIGHASFGVDLQTQAPEAAIAGADAQQVATLRRDLANFFSSFGGMRSRYFMALMLLGELGASSLVSRAQPHPAHAAGGAGCVLLGFQGSASSCSCCRGSRAPGTVKPMV